MHKILTSLCSLVYPVQSVESIKGQNAINGHTTRFPDHTPINQTVVKLRCSFSVTHVGSTNQAICIPSEQTSSVITTEFLE